MASISRTLDQVSEQKKRAPRNFDWFLLLGACLLLTFGLLSQFSKAYGTTSKEFQKQVFNVVVGLVPFAIFWLVKPKVWLRMSSLLYLANLALLFLVMRFGVNINGSARWINIGPIQFQPSEAAKILIILTVASFLANRQDQIYKFSTFALSFLHVIVPVFFIVKQPHLGAAVAIMVAWLCICLAANVPWKFVLGMVLCAGLVGVVAFKVPSFGRMIGLKEYHLNRVDGYKNGAQGAKDINFQPERAKMAFGAGQLFGTGFLKGEQKHLNRIPEQSTDYVFTIIGEEGGLVGCALVLATFGFFFYRIWLIMFNATEPFYRMLTAGILGILAFHTIVNIGMVLQLLPVIGLWLPFMSYGGTAMWLCLSCVGLLLNIRSREKPVLF